MKNTRHNLKKQILFIGFFVALFLFLAGEPTHAVVLESGIPGVGAAGGAGQPLPDLDTYINYLYIFVLSFVGIAGFISLVIWGTVWVGSAVIDKKAMALESIKNTLIGIGIALTAFIILYTINPDLTIIKEPKAPNPTGSGISVPKLGFLCKYINPAYISCLKDSFGCMSFTINLDTMKNEPRAAARGHLYGIFCKPSTAPDAPATCTPEFISICQYKADADNKSYIGCTVVDGKAQCNISP